MNKEKQTVEVTRANYEHEGEIKRYLAKNGYCKASEIFAEIEDGIKAAVSALQFENNPIHRKVKHETYSSLMRFVKTIEKKYTEGV